ncbi:MAG: glycosyltransferase, partial [Euryarchaeota archaeon]|nr:glycosyltransferase [Euryarchaeota archaeon]
MILLVIAIILISLGVIPYMVYFVGISLNKQQKKPALSLECPDISIIIPAYNEERIIEKRIRNILETDYPQDKYEVILIDDCSDDDTGIIAERIFSENGISHCIITNVKRMGTNKSFNLGIAGAKHDLIVTTGADVFFEKGALKSVISRLLSDNRIATVCADMLPSDDSSDTEPG